MKEEKESSTAIALHNKSSDLGKFRKPTCLFVFCSFLIGPCLTRCFKDEEALLSSSSHCLATLALSKITSKERDSEVEPEVEGRVSGDNWVKAGSSGNKGRPSCKCL